MKTLLLLRHGKAGPYAAPGDRDGDKARTLTGRGRRDSLTMGGKIASAVQMLDLMVTSDAQRAQETAAIAAASAGYTGEVRVEEEIYGGDVDTLVRVVRSLPDEAGRVLLVGHNPGFEELAAALAAEGTPPPHLTTAGLAHLDFDMQHWKDVRPGTGRLAAVYSPKGEG